MDEFLDAVYLGKEGDVLLPSGNAAAGAVRLATLHGAKGLEFPVVFLCGLTEKVLPLVSSRGNGRGRGTPPVLRGHYPRNRGARFDNQRRSFAVSCGIAFECKERKSTRKAVGTAIVIILTIEKENKTFLYRTVKWPTAVLAYKKRG